MKRIFFTILCLCIFNATAMAAVTECTKTDGKCPAGCEQTGLLGCDLCTAGTYNSTAGEKCKSCTVKPRGTNSRFLTGDEYAGQTSNTCPWTVTCQANQYWSTGNNFGCTDCPSGYEAKEGNQTFDVTGSGNYASSGATGNTQANRCQPKVFKLELLKNTALISLGWPFEDAEYKNYTAYAKYGIGFATDAASSEWSTSLPSGVLQPNTPIKTFKGYSTSDKAKDCGSSLYFDVSGKFVKNWNELLSDKKLYACWGNLEITINYYNSNGTTTWHVENFTIDDNQEYNGHKALPYAGNIDAGKIFQHYECTYGDGSPCAAPTINANGDVPLGSTTINLKPVFSSCDAGHYCTGGIQQDCPAGTTSDAGASSIEKCYMLTGTNGTQFCDTSNGNEKRCFHLPAQENLPDKIYY